jgi:type I restriction enzyme S subunit
MLSKPFTQYVVDCSLRVAMPKVNREALGDAWIAFPPLSEQRKILKWLAGESEGPNETIQCAQRQVSLLREYRSRIVSDVVTGKLDVRKAAEQLPDEPDRGDLVLDERLEEVAAA